MSAKVAITHVGFPEFWQKAHDMKPEAFLAIHELQGISDDLFNKTISEPLHKVIRQIAKTTVNSLGALTTLLLNGYGNDAMKVARGMWESSVIVMYLIKHPELLEDYFDYFPIKVRRQLDYLDKFSSDSVKALPASRRAEIEAEYKRVTPKFTDKNGKIRGSWCKYSIRDMATEVGLEHDYLTFYSWASSMHHMDITGVTLHANDVEVDADAAPSTRWITEALVTGHQAAFLVMAHYNDVCGHGMKTAVDKLQERFQKAWKVQKQPGTEGTNQS